MTLILGLESSCDETAAAVVEDGRRVVAHTVASQHDLHEQFGGVVPEIASRAHLECLVPVITRTLDEAGVSLVDVDAIAVGNRPGLIGSLLVGVSAAKALAWATGKPLIGVDHVQAHLQAASLYDAGDAGAGSAAGAAVEFPAVGLVVSGGHTSLYHVVGPLDMRVLGRTIDDAAGEAFDKAAVILNAGYPGGQMVDKAAQRGNAGAHKLPQSLLGPGSLDFSYSGLKTALLYKVRGHPVGRGEAARFARDVHDLSDAERGDLAAAFQHAAVGVLFTKIRRALKQLRGEGVEVRSLIIGGGVSANSRLRLLAAEFSQKYRLPVHLPAMAYCVDNAAMIAGLAAHRLAAGDVDDLTLPVMATASV